MAINKPTLLLFKKLIILVIISLKKIRKKTIFEYFNKTKTK